MDLYARMRLKASKQEYSKFHVVAVGLNKKGDVIGMTMNSPSPYPNTFNTHAECRLLIKYGRKVRKIIIARFGNSGIPRPIEPCPQCKALADSYGVKIENIDECKVD